VLRRHKADSSFSDEALEVTLLRKAKRTRLKKSHRGFRLRRRMVMVDGEQGWMKTNDVVTPYPRTLFASFRKYISVCDVHWKTRNQVLY
jgi:hypothetical protein